MQFLGCRQKTRPSTFGVAYPNIDVESTIMFDSVRKKLAKGARMHGSVSSSYDHKLRQTLSSSFVGYP